jgi:flagellar biosynthesis chaperone FliJ
MRRIGMLALGACLLAEPLFAQGQKCQSNASSSSSASTSTSSQTSNGHAARGSSSSSTTSTDQLIAQLQSQITQAQELIKMLRSGEVSPPANSGVTSTQAIQTLTRRIAYLQNAIQQLQASRNSSGGTSSSNFSRRR